MLCLLLCLSGFGQTSVSEKTIDFGDITSVSLRYYDVSMQNSSDQPAYILRVEQSPELVYNISSDIIYPDSTFFMRIQVNPKSI
jgi:hypothetical protein